MVTPDRKVRKLIYEYQKTGTLITAALKADLDPKTARKYIKVGKLPSDMKKEHTWRTQEDPFEKHWYINQCEENTIRQCWIFKDAMTTASAIDRLVHHSVILELNNKSYRADYAKQKIKK